MGYYFRNLQRATGALRVTSTRLIGGFVVLCVLPASGAPTIHHNLKVTLEPARGQLSVRDTVTVPETLMPPDGELTFLLHAGLAPRLEVPARYLIADGKADTGTSTERYRLPANVRRFTLRYSGRLRHRLSNTTTAFAKAGRATAGTIGSEGVFLSGASYWYPHIEDALVTFDVEITIPDGWHAVSQGQVGKLDSDAHDTINSWRELNPQEQIYLVAGPYKLYRRAGQRTAMVYLHHADDQLATQYLDATERYINLYNQLVGPYPYEKFALVENFWESGYGMPSFTLMGPRVIRLPFVLHSSYPHEVLHNWWGNGVYVSPQDGNWSEGLTAYLADHLVQEQLGKGAVYRRDVLQKYANYVAQATDFPLTAFRGSHRDAVQAVGYGKALMFFHMLRLRLGDEVFVNGLRRFYRMNRFRQAGFGDLQRAFEEVSRLNLDHVFKQWIERVGAPRLRLTGTDVRSSAQGYRLVGTLEQVQQGNAYELSVLLVIYLADGGVVETHLPVRGRQTPLDITLSARPRRVDVDPDFDIFRLLDHKEMPPSLGQLFGAQNVLIVVPKRAPEHLRVRYRELAERWARDTRAIEWRWDDALERLPSDRSVWLFGWSSRFLPDIANAFADQALVLTDNDVRIRDRLVNRQTEAVVLVGRHPDNDAVALAWFACESPSAFAALTRKLPHYGKYSYLAFRSDDVRNVLKGQWPVIDSPLRVRLGGVAKVVPTPFQRREQRQPLTATLN